jgi:hypothetical protein
VLLGYLERIKGLPLAKLAEAVALMELFCKVDANLP